MKRRRGGPGCSKKRYRTADDAHRALRAIEELPGDEERTEQRVYRCDRHARPTWHLTSTSEPPRQHDRGELR